MATKRSSSKAKSTTAAAGGGAFPNRHDKGYGFDPTTAYDSQFRPPRGSRGNQPGPASEAARRLSDELWVAPQEPHRVAQARRALEATSGEAREAVLGQLYAMATDEYELDAFRAIKAEVDAASPAEVDAASPAEVVEDPVARQVTEALAPRETERPAPYLDDDGRLRDPAGRAVDTMGEDWWAEPWYLEARDLLVAAGYEHADSEDG